MSRKPPAKLALCAALAQSGDAQALNQLLRDHQRPLHAHITTILGDRERAYDVLQVSLLLIARRLGSLRAPRWFRAWAYRIATREAVRAARRRSRDRGLFADDAEQIEVMPTEEPAYEPALVRACVDRI